MSKLKTDKAKADSTYTKKIVHLHKQLMKANDNIRLLKHESRQFHKFIDSLIINNVISVTDIKYALDTRKQAKEKLKIK